MQLIQSNVKRIRRSGRVGELIGHYHTSIRMDLYKRLLDVREHLGLSHLTLVNFWEYVTAYLEETHIKNEEVNKLQKQIVKEKVIDPVTIMNMSQDEVQKEIDALEKKQEEEQS